MYFTMGVRLMVGGAALMILGVILTPGATVTPQTFVADLVLIGGIVLFLWGRRVRARRLN